MKLVSSRSISEPYFDRRLQCNVHHIFYDFDAGYGRLQIGKDSSCDGRACIALFSNIDPKCRFIDVFNEGEIVNIQYRRKGWEWQVKQDTP